MEQTSLFELVEDDWDPIFVELQKLTDENRSIRIPPFTITMNPYNLYEIESRDVHDCVSTLEQCYQYLCRYSKE